jgi:hypothetical protein
MRGRPFERGNKLGKGRPSGSRNQRTVFAEMMDRHGVAVIKQCLVRALQKGDPTAMRLCMERLAALPNYSEQLIVASNVSIE